MIRSHRIVHVVFDRMRGHFEAHHLGHLEFDVAVDLVVVEDAATRLDLGDDPNEMRQDDERLRAK